MALRAWAVVDEVEKRKRLKVKLRGTPAFQMVKGWKKERVKSVMEAKES